MAPIHCLWYVFTMDSGSVSFGVPLRGKPEVLWMAEGLHGPNDTRTYRFESLWIVHFYTYTGSLLLDGREFDIRPGYAGLMPPGATSVTRFPERSRHLFAHFVFPNAADQTVPIPAMQDLGPEFSSIYAAFEEAVGWSETHRLRAEIRLWDVLWRLAEHGPSTPRALPRRHSALDRAMELIAQRLSEPIRARDLAREVDLSHNHLTRLFQEATGGGILEYVRRQRVERARHLLVYSSLPIKAVAREIGIPDLHHFNKTIRRALGDCPRGIRAVPREEE